MAGFFSSLLLIFGTLDMQKVNALLRNLLDKFHHRAFHCSWSDCPTDFADFEIGDFCVVADIPFDARSQACFLV